MSNAKTEGRGIEKTIPPPKFGTSPPFCAGSAVSALSPRVRSVFSFPLLVLAFYFPARRRSQGAKPSLLARNFGGVARVGGQRSTVKLFSLRKVLPLRRGDDAKGSGAQRNGAAGVNDSPVDCQSRRVTEPQREERSPLQPLFITGSIVSNPKTEGRGLEKSNPFPEIRNFPALFRRLGGFGVKAVSALSPRVRSVFSFPLLVLAFSFSARRRSRGAKFSPLARNYGGAARVGRRAKGENGGLSRSAGRREPRIGSPIPLLSAVPEKGDFGGVA